MHSTYQRPEISVPNEWKTPLNTQTSTIQDEAWWNNFNDPLLSALIEQALANSSNMALAGNALMRARTMAGLIDSAQTPQFGANASASRADRLDSEISSSASYGASVDLNYEVDLYGKLASIRNQAEWQATAAEEDMKATKLLLIEMVAQLYWRIANLNYMIDIEHRALALHRKSIELARSRVNAGDILWSEFLQVEQTVLDSEDMLLNLQRDRAEARNALGLLMNSDNPSIYTLERDALDLDQRIGVAEYRPIQVIARRPDIQAAEWQLRAALAGTDAATLSLFPPLRLAATLGAGGALARDWFDDPVGSISASTAIPFLQWQTVQLNIKLAKLEEQSTAIQFRQVVYKALAEVDDAMFARYTYELQLEREKKRFHFAQQRAALANSQHKAGAISLQSLLDIQSALLTSEKARSTAQYEYLRSTMRLWLAQGGG